MKGLNPNFTFHIFSFRKPLRQRQFGFTLIELLVVIAIIGLLAGIVLISLGSSRDSAKDARIQTALSQTRSIAELVRSTSSMNSYSPICDGSGTLNDSHATYGSQLAILENDIQAQSGSLPGCFASDGNYCISAPAATPGLDEFCIDDAGILGTRAGGCTISIDICTP